MSCLSGAASSAEPPPLDAIPKISPESNNNSVPLSYLGHLENSGALGNQFITSYSQKGEEPVSNPWYSIKHNDNLQATGMTTESKAFGRTSFETAET